MRYLDSPAKIFVLLLVASLGWLVRPSCAQVSSTFHIQVIDKESGRGIPLVELRTVNDVRFTTDSAGNISIDDSDLLNRKVFFHVTSHGYEYPKDGFGYRGLAIQTIPGKKTTIEMNRINLAERLYRITGTGIYNHSRKLKLPLPIQQNEVNSLVLGSDSVVNAVYRNKLYWFWGDTNRMAYPLGNFQVSGATSKHPSEIDIEKGIQLDYFEDNKLFAKQMAPIPGSGPTWTFGLFVSKDLHGNEKLIAKYEKIKAPLTPYQRGLVLFNDEKKQFEKWVQFEMDAPIYPDGQAFIRKEKNDREFTYFATPFPVIRVENSLEKIKDPKNYEAYTYFKSGQKVPKDAQGKLIVSGEMLERDSRNQLVVRWKKNAQPISPRIEQSLVRQKLIKRSEAITLLKDPTQAAVNKDLMLASGSVAWNTYRKKWIMIAVQAWGTSMLGEVWFAESDALEGPWESATKVVTHNDYSFYNPRHHPYFDKQGGRQIYFEGTYTKMFSGTKIGTPRYDYNQIMYKLDLDKIHSNKSPKP